ncbi:ATP-grasp domain-containing protein [Erwinia pyrifoliae]|uniref:ATP-grasp domain-containing protein n=1 Tax=Erwinia pyrifoliae TaxID=79967 RepID=A0ABY5X9F3_ERWPY|nr:ATP-grasp domain-containing protein [Erwinia pyrifoliae]MCT2385867.1 ATP-grasp domain-containing protein [Erwinia pyrifoliae]MCU8588556.1 ATP-grasp domain-containing protein [Erwinia pyrifoliae]UWS29705.1 ATP-grasp domain-containing protein [Erwinia pyrifoliae]UWS34020.1 ATP-grasp domain-containing protein [Erwinia pyrifoliae]UXK12692.1 ATP-grasp domain-containing protein [Erwinia pyrifoliae]
MENKGIVIIVDAYSPTRRLAPEFIRQGYRCARVQSTPEIPDIYKGSFSLDDYCENIIHQGDLAVTLQKVASLNPVAIIAGGEIGVELADILSENLGLASNGTALSAARRHKYTMIERLRSVGLPATRQCLPANGDALRLWHQKTGGRIVVKPARSAAGEGVHFCDTPEASNAALQAIIGKKNIFSEINQEVVAQEYLCGTEYVVNTVSCQGKHRVTDIWRTTRVSVNGFLDMGDSIHIMPRHGEIQETLVSYALQVLNAMNIQYGPGHMEIKMCDDGPCLVEIGARIAGGDMPYYAELATGQSQLNWTQLAYTDPEKFHALYDIPYTLNYYFSSVAMLSPCEGILEAYPYKKQISQLESLLEIREYVKPGDRIYHTIDDTTYPMLVLLKHKTEEVVLRDWGTLRYLDGHAFYKVH